MKAVSYLTLVTAICVVIMAPRSASADMYRFNNYGRFHGYLYVPEYQGIALSPTKANGFLT